MAWPTSAVATGELITAAQLNGLPVMIANSTLSGDAANIDFTSIPSHYAHLMVVCYARGDTAATTTNLLVRFNNDSGGNYDYQRVSGVAAAATAGESFAQTSCLVAAIPANTADANLFGATTFDVPHYANTANNKDLSSQYANKITTTTGNLNVSAVAGFWRSSAAITRITLLPAAGNLRSGSRATLYGLA
jgi:hypothetical protein